MNKKDIPILVAVVGLVMAWPWIDRQLIAPMFPKKAPPALVAPTNETAAVASASAQSPAAGPRDPAKLTAGAPVTEPAAADPDAEEVSDQPEQTVVLSNKVIRVAFSSRGAAIASSTMLEYHQTVDPKSPPVELEFRGAPALANTGIPGLGDAFPFAFEADADGRTVRFTRRTKAGLVFARTVRLGDGYLMQVDDELRNEGGAPVELKNAGTQFGPMRNLPGESVMKGYVYLGVDTSSPGEKVTYWGAKLDKLFKTEQEARSLARPPPEVKRPIIESGMPADWAAVKNKYFVQLLKPAERAANLTVTVRREVSEKEIGDPTFKPATVIREVAATLDYPSTTLMAGGEGIKRSLEFYLGPKKYSELHRLDAHREEVMDLGRYLGGIAKVLLVIMNGIYSVLPNYGVAIMLLTILVRIIFWPLTHKSTQSMKRMAEIQPLVNDLKKKYEKDPQKLQRATMELYKEHKINPLGGCLPIMVQIPVFIALFNVLRSAIELRYAPFLWIGDLSEPENLLAGMMPFGLALNILPLLMTATQVWQQKLTPAAGDPMQQKMMTWMPVIMLVFFYNFAAGLVLYWTTNQVLMIVQLYMQKYRREHHGAKK